MAADCGGDAHFTHDAVIQPDIGHGGARPGMGKHGIGRAASGVVAHHDNSIDTLINPLDIGTR